MSDFFNISKPTTRYNCLGPYIFIIALPLLWKTKGTVTLEAGNIIILLSLTIAFSGNWLKNNFLGFYMAEFGFKTALLHSALVNTGNIAGNLQSAVIFIYNRKR